MNVFQFVHVQSVSQWVVHIYVSHIYGAWGLAVLSASGAGIANLQLFILVRWSVWSKTRVDLTAYLIYFRIPPKLIATLLHVCMTMRDIGTRTSLEFKAVHVRHHRIRSFEASIATDLCCCYYPGQWGITRYNFPADDALILTFSTHPINSRPININIRISDQPNCWIVRTPGRYIPPRMYMLYIG